jgi:NAD(P)-dependent dehydrogenase (short-subunit alcohol dehydrogenase family)
MVTNCEAGVLLVTGGARGIGRAVAELAGARGWAVGVNYRTREDAALGVVQRLHELGARAVALRADVSDELDVVRLFDETQRSLGPISAVVNSAGIVAPIACLADMTAERLSRVVAVNVLGALLVAREAARRLSTARGGPGGVLVNISSIAARLGAPGEYVDYAASKGAVDALTLGLARELGREGVRVNAVRPGLIDTEIHRDSGSADRARRLGQSTPIGRPGTAREVAAAVVWLLSDEASYLTGSIVDVSGGR